MAVAGWGGLCEAEVPGADCKGWLWWWVLVRGGAVDCTVVKVVVNERTDGAGEEKVLFLSPSVLGAVALVPAPDGA